MPTWHQTCRNLIAGGAAILFLALPSFALAGPVITTQIPCAVVTTECVTITSTGQYSLRNILFVPPSTGTVMILFHGSGYCQSSNNQRGFVEIDTQILPNNTATPNGVAAGGARYFLTVEPVAGAAPNGYVPLNLNSVRVLSVPTIANRRYYFTMNVSRIDPNISCGFNNLSFSLHFTP